MPKKIPKQEPTISRVKEGIKCSNNKPESYNSTKAVNTPEGRGRVKSGI